MQGLLQKTQKAVAMSNALEAELLHTQRCQATLSWDSTCTLCYMPLRSSLAPGVPSGAIHLFILSLIGPHKIVFVVLVRRPCFDGVCVTQTSQNKKASVRTKVGSIPDVRSYLLEDTCI